MEKEKAGKEMGYKNTKFRTEDGIGILTIDRPKVLNALNTETVKEIRAVLMEVKENKTLRALIVTGSGDKAFVSGGDIDEIRSLGLKDGFEFVRLGDQMNYDIETLGIPTLAAINGFALGGGCEMAMACTLRVVSQTAKLGLPELELGAIPGYGGTQRLARLIGRGRALWYLLTGDMIDAAKAVDIGLANMMVKPDELMGKTIEVAKKITTKGPLAIKMVLLAIKYGMETDLETGLILESALANIAIASEDQKEGIAAFFEKRSPNFMGK